MGTLTVSGKTPRSKKLIDKKLSVTYTGTSSFYGGKTLYCYAAGAGTHAEYIVEIAMSPDECLRLAKDLLDLQVDFEGFAKFRNKYPEAK